MLQDFDDRWEDEALRADILDVARKLECEPSIVGASAHLLGVGADRCSIIDNEKTLSLSVRGNGGHDYGRVSR